MNRTAYQPIQHVSYEPSPHRMRYNTSQYPLYSRTTQPAHIPEPMSTTVYGRQSAPNYSPMFSGNQGVERMGSHTLPTHVGQPVWWYEVEVFKDPNPIPIITRDPPQPARVPYDYNRYRSTPFVTEVADDYYGDRQLRHRGDQYFERLMPHDRYIEDGIYSVPPRAKSVPTFI